MSLYALVRRESRTLRRDLVVAVLVSGAANAAILAVINSAAARDIQRGRLLLMFLCAVGLYVVGLRASHGMVNRLFGDAVHAIRVRLTGKLQKAGLAAVERAGRGEIYDAVTRETTTIAEAGELVTTAMQSAVLVVFAALYVALISRPAFVVILLFVAACIFIVQHNRAAVHAFIRRTTEHEIEYLGAVTDALEGFKEARLHARRRRDLLAYTAEISTALSGLKLRTAELYNRNFMFTQYSFYLLIGVIVFLLPRVLPVASGRVGELTTSILFVIAPLTAIVASIPDISRASIAAATVERVEAALDAAAEVTEGERRDLTDFRALTLENVAYTHRGEGGDAFRVGPLSWTLRRGSIVFIVGGNGSGKSTFLKMLTGLYPVDDGRVTVDGAAVERRDLPSYRALFSTIFGDFHLFDRLYGEGEADAGRVDELLRVMQLGAKTGFRDGRFTNLSLSTGQRKRLALIVCLLEERPVLVLDELAADQDPEFRAFLYETLLPQLRAEGKTIVAVTHDDRWFSAADEVWKMEYGQLRRMHQG